jgi:hypothetical protein
LSNGSLRNREPSGTVVRLTLNRYRHVQPEEYDRAAAAMERRLASPP